MPALHGKPLQRDAIFTYFPHSPDVPDWLPPAVSVHQGDWKLIRIFFGGENGQHRYKLFNLNDDLGERNNLADQRPDRVKELDALIEQFLVDTQAVRPLPNPNFDPAKYDAAAEGQAALKGEAKAPTTKPKPNPAIPVAGWQPSAACELVLKNGSLIVRSAGGDPHLSFRLPEPIAGETLTLHFAMTSDAQGSGQVFWHEQGVTPAFFRRSVEFEARHNGQSHDYAISFSPKKPILAIRIDPARGPGTLQLSSLKLTDANGSMLYEWRW